MSPMVSDHDPLQPVSHEPNPAPPSADPALHLAANGEPAWLITPADLATLPQTAVSDCLIVSTGHGTSGPFTFGGVTLHDLIAAYCGGPWREAEIVSADGFGNRVLAEEVVEGSAEMADPAGDTCQMADRCRAWKGWCA